MIRAADEESRRYLYWMKRRLPISQPASQVQWMKQSLEDDGVDEWCDCLGTSRTKEREWSLVSGTAKTRTAGSHGNRPFS